MKDFEIKIIPIISNGMRISSMYSQIIPICFDDVASMEYGNNTIKK